MVVTARRPAPDFLPVFVNTDRQPPISTARFGERSPDVMIGFLSIKEPAIATLSRWITNGQKLPDHINIAISHITLGPRLRVVGMTVGSGVMDPSGISFLCRLRSEIVYNDERITTLHFDNELAGMLHNLQGFVPLPDWAVYLMDQCFIADQYGMTDTHFKKLQRDTSRKLDLDE